MSEKHDTSHILQSLLVNLAISTGKGIAAYFTGSGAMLAETIHSFSDSGNQLLLLLGVKRSAKPATEKFPLGFGRELYFWSFMVAMLLFTGGGVFSIYEGYHKLEHPEPIQWVWVGLVVLIFSFLLEGYATFSNIKVIRAQKGDLSFLRYLCDTKDSDLVVVFGENLAASLGLLVAIPALVMAWYTGDPSWDAIGSIFIGIILVAVALFLTLEVKSLLLGERADKRIEQVARGAAAKEKPVSKVFRFLTVQQGPGQVVLMMKVGILPESTAEEIAASINRIEDEVRSQFPEVTWSFIEPDIERRVGGSV